MNHKFTFTHPLALLALLGGMALATACTDDAVPDGGNQNPDAAQRGESITLSATLPADLAGARTTITETGISGNLSGHSLKSTWTPRDAFIVCAKKSNTGDKTLPLGATRTAVFTTANGGIPSAAFTGTDITYDDDALYDCLAIYPAKPVDNTETLEQSYSYSGQVQRGNGDTRHLGDFDYMFANENRISSLANADFKFERISSFFRFVITMPETDTPVSLNLTAPTGEGAFGADANTARTTNSLTLAFSDMAEIAANRQLVAYLAVKPGQMANTDFVLTLTCTNHTYSCRAKGHSDSGSSAPADRYYVPGKVYDVAIDGNWQLAAADNIIYTKVVAGALNVPVLLNTNGQNSADNPYLIEKNSNRHWLVKNVNEGGSFPNGDPAATAYYRLISDVEVNGPNIPSQYYFDWTPIGTADNPFQGHFDGAGHVITGILRGDDPEFGFFGHVEPNKDFTAAIRNLTVMADVESTFADTDVSSRSVGAIVGAAQVNVTVENCHFGGHLTVLGHCPTYCYVGGIIGIAGVGGVVIERNDISRITGCTTTSGASVSFAEGVSVNGAANLSLGGIAGECTYATTVSGCTNGAAVSGPVVASGTGNDPTFYTGGVAGCVRRENQQASIRQCTNNGAVTGGVHPGVTTYTGGVVGFLSVTSASNLVNRGTVSVAVTPATEVKQCGTGGIAGALSSNPLGFCDGTHSLLYADNEGKVTGGAAVVGSYTGGIAGDNLDIRPIHLCHNGGNVWSPSVSSAAIVAAGAWMGYNSGNITTSDTTTFGFLYDCCTIAPGVTVDGVPANPQTNGIGGTATGGSDKPAQCTEGHRGDMQMP